MKLSVAIAGQDALPSAFVVWRGFEESIRKAAEFGYQGVELALGTAEDVDRDKLAGWLQEHKIAVSSISTGQVFAAYGQYLTHPDNSVRIMAENTLIGLIRLARDFGQLVNIGRARGMISEKQSKAEAEDLLMDSLIRLCDEAVKNQVTLVLEPVNRYEINFINTLDEGAALINKLGCSNLGLMPDVFHMNIEDDKIGPSLIRNAEYVNYIHLADSNRLAPGKGHLDFDEIFAALQSIRYDGWAAVEILPKPDPDTAARDAVKFLNPLMNQYNKKLNKSGTRRVI